MWNPIVIGKSINFLLTEFGEGNDLKPETKDENGEVRISYILSLYRELNIPFGPMMTLRNRRTKKGRDVCWGRKHNDPDYIESVVIPKLMDFDYLKSLPKNTIGAGYYRIVKEYGIEDLYNQRFSQEEANKFKGAYSSFAEEIRANCSRHILLTHDNWHILTGYNTDTLGEALLQTITAKCFNLYQAHLVGFFGTLKVVKETKSWLPFKAWLECLRLSKQIDSSFVYYGPLEFIEKDVSKLRKKFNIKEPEIYNEYYQKYKLELSNTD